MTHGILFPDFEVLEQRSNDNIGIFADTAEFYNPKSIKTPVEKEKLNPLFAAIMEKLHIDANHDGKLDNTEVKFEAGKLKGLSFYNKQALLPFIVKHKNEWATDRNNDFQNLCNLFRDNNLSEHADNLQKRTKDLAIHLKAAPFSTDTPAHYLHPLAVIGGLKSSCRGCGKSVINKIKCTRYKSVIYGPIYKGNTRLKDYTRWDNLIAKGKITSDEKDILAAMSENEGNLDAVQSYDSEILTAGAMQKTINSHGQGELPKQMYEFKIRHPNLFEEYFACCGWDVKRESGKTTAYYKGVTGSALKYLIRQGFNKNTYNKNVAIIAEGIMLDEYQDLQVEDFIDRVHKALGRIPKGYTLSISNYIKSQLGKATVLDHDINRPAHVSKYFGKALDHFYGNNPKVSKYPTKWGTNHEVYEKEILDYYGINRSGTDMPKRYNKFKGKL